MDIKVLDLSNRDNKLVGCGDLYAMPAKDFKVKETTYEEMVYLGDISEDGATLRRTGTVHAIKTANNGKRASFVSGYETEFDTSVITLNKDNMTIFTTGSEAVEQDDGTIIVYGSDTDEPANLALCFRCTTKEGKKFDIYLPNAVWVPELEWEFNPENPIALNMHFDCNSVDFPNGTRGSWYYQTNLPSFTATAE